MRRRKAATERVRSSSAEVAVVTVRRPRWRGSAPRVGRGVGSIGLAVASCGSGRCGAGGRGVFRLAGRLRARRDGATGAARGDRRLARLRRGGRRRRLAAGEAPARLLLRRLLEIGLLRRGALLLALARFGRFALGPLARLALAADGGVALLAAPVLFLAGARIAERAGARLALLVGQRRAARRRCAAAAARSARAARRSAPRGGGRRGAAAAGAGAAAAGASEIAPAPAARAALRRARRRAASSRPPPTLLRPCEKLWRTVPASTGRFRCSVGFADSRATYRRCCSYPSCVVPATRLSISVSAMRVACVKPAATGCRSAPPRPTCRRSGARLWRGRPRSPAPHAALHVSHLSAPMPNPIAPIRNRFIVATRSPEAPRQAVELFDPVRRALAGVDEGDDAGRRAAPPRPWPRRRPTSPALLTSARNCRASAARSIVDLAREIGADLDRPAEAAGEAALGRRARDRRGIEPRPHAAARQPAADVRGDHALEATARSAASPPARPSRR